MSCDHCKYWGPTIEELHSHTIVCPMCKRYTYANLGVNCPAGSAWAFSSSKSIEILKAIQMGQSINVAGQIIDGQARLNALAISNVPDNFPYPEKWRHYQVLEVPMPSPAEKKTTCFGYTETCHERRRRSGSPCEEETIAGPAEIGTEFSHSVRIVAADVVENVSKSPRGRIRGTASNGAFEGVD